MPVHGLLFLGCPSGPSVTRRITMLVFLLALILDCQNMFHSLIKWLSSLDPKEIVYALVATVVATIATMWLGGIRAAKRRFALRKGLSLYKKSLREDCLFLTVIGRRQGFSLKDTYIQLDLAASDLGTNKPESVNSAKSSTHVIVAGPGAGKSTIVKHRILNHLENSRVLPFFVRLRDYTPEKSVQESIADQLRGKGVPDTELVVNQNLRLPGSLCVLDGLDEVRPNLAPRIYDRINAFYKEFFAQGSGTLIVTCRKEAYRNIPLDLPNILEVRPLTDEQIQRFTEKWPLSFPPDKSADRFLADLFATPRIHELARSPLLLIGGLMQYTESNLGVPEERVQYLARVAQWLVSDWATAQGHPPDKFRTLYPRILARLGLHLQLQGNSQCLSTEATRLIASWLPGYGFDAGEAGAVLSGLVMRTGILVRDQPELVIFSQFGLQEYYASIDFLASVDGAKVHSLAAEIWWREVILLSIAQEKEPSKYVDELFPANQFLAAEAVAECPTPSIALQERAMASCLIGIDGGVPTARTATVRLLRKVKGPLEERLTGEMESRLTAELTAEAAGLVLATAGTPATTAALARHPSVWGACLQNTGFLSNSMEKLLVTWIKNGTYEQSRHATDLLANKLSSDRSFELVSMLPRLELRKADYVARMLLGRMADDPPDSYALNVSGVSPVAACVSRLQPPIPTAEYVRRLNVRSWGLSQFIVPALALRRSLPQIGADRLKAMLENCSAWASNKGSLTAWICAALILSTGGAFPKAPVWAFTEALVAVLGISYSVAWSGYLPPSMLPLMARRRSMPPAVALNLFFIGVATALVFQRGKVISVGRPEFWQHSFLAALCALLGSLVYVGDFPPFLTDTPRLVATAKIAAWSVAGLSIFCGLLNLLKPYPLESLLQVAGGASLAVFAYSAYVLRRDYQAVRRALEHAEREQDA